jgi:hypothetical protein
VYEAPNVDVSERAVVIVARMDVEVVMRDAVVRDCTADSVRVGDREVVESAMTYDARSQCSMAWWRGVDRVKGLISYNREVWLYVTA